MRRIGALLLAFVTLVTATAQTASAQAQRIETGQPATAGRTTRVGDSTLGQRRQRGEAVGNEQPLRRLDGRFQTRVQSRIRNRIDQNYNPNANAQSPFRVASDQARTRR